ncbi:disease resistance protein At4g27190-like isoform X2 [Juglans regia]|uniref:Disease resistance protein At4g27190-like isoform X2 n=1 Tax=Juglans regia TaxID=51240 RepID=A0A6P9E5H2_JUGRE|nr:disease resistance protein At4g27190-like isoform X2 [Juglans regia]
MESIPISIAAKIAEYTVAPVGRWLCYSFHYSKNMENLKNQKEKLQDAKERWQQSVDDALIKGEKIYSDVSKWLGKFDAITNSATSILREGEEKAEGRSSHATCLNLKQRHRLSREANKMVRNIVKHLENGNFTTVGFLPAAQDHMVTTRVKNYVTLDSRTSLVNGIMEKLGDANINKIGVWGMPGVGKSTLMKEIERRAKEEKLFHGVVLAAVTENPDLSRIREQIAVMLNQVLHRQQTEIGRENDLQRESSTKDAKLLVILDDIWKPIELEDIGIPSEGCKVVLTSRNRDVLVNGMGTEANFELESLGEEEAWNLFEKMAGDSVKDRDVREVAIKVAKECAGLPVALTTVSKALKGKSLSIWKDAELQLKRPPPVDVPEIVSPIYSCIELSYNHLADKELKSLFLLCALVGQFNIYYQDLLKYGFGWGLFQRNIVTLEEARHKLDSLVSDLQDSCLLLESSNTSGEFYMHDVVRYVATIIGSNHRNMLAMRDSGGLKAWPDVDSLKRCQAFSILGGDIDQLPNEMECPELRLFYVHLEDRSLQIPDTFFQGMDKLNVLDMTKMQLPSLPSSLLHLRNLQTLCLAQCVLGDISGIGELKNLLILSLLHSDISTLPREIGSLVHLRLLDLRNCSKLEMIPPNVISRLVKLEELYMGNSFVQWEDECLNDERKNVNLAELKHLSKLTTLEIQIPDANNLPKDLVFKKLERYTICIGDVWHWIDSADQSSRTLKLKLNSSFQLEFWVKMLLKRTENLHLDELDGVKSVIPEIDEEGFQQLMHLQIQNNGEIKHILNLRTLVIAFPTLETLVLENMISLEEICHGKLCVTSFNNLRVLEVKSCNKLRYVFSSSIARGLPLLEELEVRSCNNMGAIVVEEEEDGDTILFHKLHTLVLIYLPKLVSFLSTKNSFMTDCGEIIMEGNQDIHMPLLHHQVAFPSLKKLTMKGLPKIKHVWSLKSFFPTSVISNLEQLKILHIDDCGIEEIVIDEGGRDQAVARLVFPRVTELYLRNLRKLKWFYKGMHVSTWPMLKKMRIYECKKVKIFAAGVVNFQETVEARQSIKQPFFLVDELSFPSLESLSILHMDMLEIIWQDQVSAISFSNIQDLWISFCEKLLHVFQSNLLTTTFMQSLSTLSIARCSSLESIFEKLEVALIALKSGMTEDGSGAATHFVLLPTLTEVRLYNLPKLKWILEGEHTLEWPSLKKLQLWRSQQILMNRILVSNFSNMSCTQQPIVVVKESTFPNLEILTLHFNRMAIWPSKFPDFAPSFLTRMPNLLEFKVYDSGWKEIFPYELLDPEVQVMIVPRLRRLLLESLPMLAHLWKEDTQPCPLFYNLEILDVLKCNKLRILVPSTVSLRNLTDLSVSNCHGLINLVTSSTARTLLQLNKMTIRKCKNITIIVAMEDGEANVAITFNKLTYLELDGLPNLTNFCSGASSFWFPSLERVIVRCCPEMKTFCQGILSTPKLKGVQATKYKDDSHWEHDLNTTTLRLWESNDDDTQWLLREMVENSKEDEDHHP